MNKYFLFYDEKANINYCFLFCLYCIAAKNPKERFINYIKYDSLKELSFRIEKVCKYKISISTISRILNDKIIYNNYFIENRTEKEIILKNNFKNSAANNKFIILCDTEIKFLIENNNNQLSKYYLYLKYYCGYSKSKKIDTTAV